VLWGDVIRGCFCRHKGGAAVQLEDEDDEDDADEVMDSESECMPPAPVQQKQKQKRAVKRAKSPVKSKSKATGRSKGKAAVNPPSDGELFDLSGIDSDESESPPVTVQQKKSKPKKAVKGAKSRAKSKSKTSDPSMDPSSEGEFFDLSGINSDELESIQPAPVQQKQKKAVKRANSPVKLTSKATVTSKGKVAVSRMDPPSDGEFFNLSGADSDESDSFPARVGGLKKKMSELSISSPADEDIIILSD
jgi:structure-specific endonuclease subunit SLX1